MTRKITFDPSEYIKSIKQILISDKKRIGFLCGAGTSLSRKNDNTPTVPALTEMMEQIVGSLTEENFQKAINEIKTEIKGSEFNVETLLTKLEEKHRVVCNGNLNGLNQDEFYSLLRQVKKKVHEIVSIHEKIDNANNLVHTDFAQWICCADRKYPVEIFTLNYDYLFEIGLETKSIPYYDGFTGSYRPFFDSVSSGNLKFLPDQTKLWKIHGSLGWHYDEQEKKVHRDNSDKDDILIYPSMLKYENSKKQPYSTMIDRLSGFISQPESVLFICGYSFGDEHINERITTALKSRTNSHVYAFFYPELTEDNDLVKLAAANPKLSILSPKHAVFGGKYGEWKLKNEPNKEDSINIDLYFDEEMASLDDKVGEENLKNEVWTGKGKLILPDFSKFVTFLDSMIDYNKALIDE